MDFFSKCDQIHSFLQIWSHLRKKSLMENFTFCAVQDANTFSGSPWIIKIYKQELPISEILWRFTDFIL